MINKPYLYLGLPGIGDGLEKVIQLKAGDLVKHKDFGHVREDRSGLTGVVIKTCINVNDSAVWSPLIADVLWSDGIITEGYLAAALEVID